VDAPRTHYAHSGSLSIAYQVSGAGPFDLVVVPPIFSHLELEWSEFADYRRFFERLGQSCRVIRFDKRGMGMSDRVGSTVPSTEERMDDIRAVMDAAGSQQTALLGISEGGGIGALFAATFPERTKALALFGSSSRALQAPDYPEGVDPELWESLPSLVDEHWGEGLFAATLMAPSLAFDPKHAEAAARFERLAASPGAVRESMRINAVFDARSALPLVRVPTLVMHRRDEIFPGVAHGRYIARHIPEAKYIEYEGSDHFPWFGDTAPAVVADLEEFLTGQRRDEIDVDRVLATVLFTDIVDSTRRAAALGDRQWRALLDQHDECLRRQVGQFRGQLVKNTGDGGLAAFDGPGRAVRCATRIGEEMHQLGLEIRSGLHAGEIERRGDDIGGIAVHIGARVAALAGPGEVWVSSTVKDLMAGSDIEFAFQGAYALKGVPGEWNLYQLTSV
jgi:class 3 adenylate cyclase